MNKSNQCAICCQVIGNEDGDLLAQLLNKGNGYVRRIILETEHFVVFPSVGPLKIGHIILCPKSHYTSFARLPEDLEKEYQNIKAQLRNFLNNTFKEAVHIFEHGSNVECSRIPCSVEHAHQHFVPTNVDVLDTLRNGIEWKHIQSNIASLSQGAGRSEYLFYESPNGETIMAVGKRDGFESQYIRRVFANALGKSDLWNWRIHPSPIDVEETFELLSSAPVTID